MFLAHLKFRVTKYRTFFAHRFLLYYLRVCVLAHSAKSFRDFKVKQAYLLSALRRVYHKNIDSAFRLSQAWTWLHCANNSRNMTNLIFWHSGIKFRKMKEKNCMKNWRHWIWNTWLIVSKDVPTSPMPRLKNWMIIWNLCLVSTYTYFKIMIHRIGYSSFEELIFTIYLFIQKSFTYLLTIISTLFHMKFNYRSIFFNAPLQHMCLNLLQTFILLVYGLASK